MKIAIDTADLGCKRIDGTRVYIQNVLKYLGRLSPEDEFFLFHKKKYNKLLQPLKFDNYVDKKIGKGFWWTQIKFARELKKLQKKNCIDKNLTCWMPIQQIPFLFFRYNKNIKYVVTIHDLAFKFFPDHFPLTDRLKINFYTNIAIRRADKIVAVSWSTKRDIIKLYPKVNINKIKVIHHGFDRENFMQKFSDNEKRFFLKKYELGNKKYLLYVGAIQPRKDIVTLIKSFEKLRNCESVKYNSLKLVLAGEVAWKANSTIEAVKNSEFKKDIIITGKINFKELALFYRLAKVFVFPSLYEGFGIPLLEAMASETPVIISDSSSLSEIGDKAVLKFKSGNIKDLTKQLKRLLNNKRLQQEIIKKGLNQIKKFSWEKCAEETLEFLKNK